MLSSSSPTPSRGRYDGLYRLTNEVQTSTSSTTELTHSTSYEYDKAGNRWKKLDEVGGTTTTTTNRYNANDQLLKEVTLVNGTATQTNTYAYDLNGSVIARTNISDQGTAEVLYGYNLANRLSSVTANGTTTTYHYNDSGIRVRKSSGTTATHYLVDANNHTGYAQVLEEFYESGGSTNLTMSYVLGDDVLGQATCYGFNSGRISSQIGIVAV